MYFKNESFRNQVDCMHFFKFHNLLTSNTEASLKQNEKKFSAGMQLFHYRRLPHKRFD